MDYRDRMMGLTAEDVARNEIKRKKTLVGKQYLYHLGLIVPLCLLLVVTAFGAALSLFILVFWFSCVRDATKKQLNAEREREKRLNPTAWEIYESMLNPNGVKFQKHQKEAIEVGELVKKWNKEKYLSPLECYLLLLPYKMELEIINNSRDTNGKCWYEQTFEACELYPHRFRPGQSEKELDEYLKFMKRYLVENNIEVSDEFKSDLYLVRGKRYDA